MVPTGNGETTILRLITSPSVGGHIVDCAMSIYKFYIQLYAAFKMFIIEALVF